MEDRRIQAVIGRDDWRERVITFELREYERREARYREERRERYRDES